MAWPRACCAIVARVGATVGPDDAGSSEHRRGTEGSKEEAVVLAVEREEGQSGGSGGGRGSSEPAMAGALVLLR